MAVLVVSAIVAAACTTVAATVGSHLATDAKSEGRSSSQAASRARQVLDARIRTADAAALAEAERVAAARREETTTTVTTLPRAGSGLVAGRVTVVGDSVTIDAAPSLQALIPGCVVDAQVGEQWETGVASLAALRSEGELGDVVVVALGTNGPVSTSEFAQMMTTLSGVSRVVIVTNHAPDYWEEQNNAMFFAEARHYPTVRIADWDAAAKANPGWLYSDDTHMPIGGVGAHAWAELVKAQI